MSVLQSELFDVQVDPADVKKDGTCSFFGAICAMAAHRNNGLILAIEDSYETDDRSVSNVFLKVDADSAHSPNATFRNEELDTLLDDALLPTVGELDPKDHAMRNGFARERVMAYAECKASLMQAHALSSGSQEQEQLLSVPSNVSTRLLEAEAVLMSGMPVTPTQIDEIAASQIEYATFNNGKVVVPPMEAEQQLERQSKMGTEKFISFVFPPHDHSELAAADAVKGGLRITDTDHAYPAYVTVHNAKGCIEALPATSTEQRPNSFIVGDAAAMLQELHALSRSANREHVLITHSLLS
jgi:hypothetical protein